jgi:hypothetical protein
MRVSRAKFYTLAVAIVAAATINPRVLAQAPQGQGQGVEQDVEGVLEVQIEDSNAGSVMHHFLDTGSGKIKLHGRPDGAEFLGLTTGATVRVHGRKSDANTLDLSGSGSVTTLALATSNTFGQQRIAVILVNFQDNASQPYSWSDAANVTFSQTSDWYRENSYNQTSLTGDVFGWFTIAASSTTCDTDQITTLAEQAATNAGVNLNNYPRRVFGFPSANCPFWGRSTVGGNPSRAWINGSYALKVVAHELGHSFGLYHSNSMPCDTGGCTPTEYGDDRDMMGQGGIGDFNAYQKERLGWLNYGSSPTVQSISTSGTYWISSLQAGGAPSALKILKSRTTADTTYYYIESRAQSSYDASYAPGVLLHTGNQNDGNSAYQVDLDPVSPSFDPLLDPGQVFSDAAAGLTVQTVSSDASGAWVTITYAGTPCTTSTPTVTLSPGSAVTTPATSSAYTMTVKNNDGTGCSAAGFGIGMTVPSGWAWAAAQPSISVTPGTTAGTTVYVTPSSTASGSATVSASALRDGSGPSGSASASLTVANGLTVSLQITGGSNFQIVTTVKAGGPAVTGASVTVRVTDPKGAVDNYSGTTSANGTMTVKGKLKGKDPHGTYQVLVTATAGGMTGSAVGTFVY